MINKFPYLTKKTKKQILEWIDIEIHERMATHHMYKACGNCEEAECAKYMASAYRAMKITIEYHMRDAKD